MLNERRSAVAESQGTVQYMLARDVVLVAAEDGSARLLDMDGAFFVLSAIASEMLQDTLAHGAEETVVRIATRYSESSDQVQLDLNRLLNELRRRGLIDEGSAALPRHRLRRMLAAVCIGPPLRLLGLIAPLGGISTSILLIFARACFMLFGWGSTVSAWTSVLPRRLSLSTRDQQYLIDRIDENIRDASGKIPFLACKERALCCWYLLNLNRVSATLVVGIQLYPLSGHCWCQVGRQILTDVPGRCSLFDPVVRYGPVLYPCGEDDG